MLLTFFSFAQNYPTFSLEKNVTINGLTFDAMEPFISPDGDYLFFNNLNDGINTKLYFATYVNDSTFTFVDEINGTNQTNPQLNAVADIDEFDNFYWTSTRDYPAQLDNLHHGTISNGTVTNIDRVYGDFNKNTPGWLVMDHGISLDGQYLYFNNARFGDSTCQGPCETEIGVAEKANDSTFYTLSNSESILQTVNDTNFKFYAPCISSNNLELYYTRYPDTTVLTPESLFEICVVVRNSPNDNFSEPTVLFSAQIGNLIEAPTLTQDMTIMYYHKKTPTSHKIVMRKRTSILKSKTEMLKNNVSIYPNPSNGQFTIDSEINNLEIKISNSLGQITPFYRKDDIITLKDNQKSGVYLIKLIQNEKDIKVIKHFRH